MRPLWNGSIGFGLVNIPIGLYSATEESSLPFFTLDKKNKARIRYKKINETTGKEVKEGDIIKGYKVGSHTVIMEDEDFEKAMPGKSDHIEIIQFVLVAEIDTLYYEKPYYIAPTKGGEKAYGLLRDALKKEGKAALGSFVFHKREWVCMIKPSSDALVLNQLRFAEEIRSTKGLEIPQITIKTDELKMAASLISQLTKPFKPEQFKDEYAEKLLKIIEAKSKGKGTKFKPMKVVHTTGTEDIMAQLKASLKTTAKKAS